MSNVISKLDSEVSLGPNMTSCSTEPSHEAERDARVRRSLARLDHVCDNIDEREELLRHELEHADAATKYAYVRAIADDAFEQWQGFCFVLSKLHVATTGTALGAQMSSSAHELGEILEHLSITGGAGKEDASAQSDRVSQREAAMLSTPAESTHAEQAIHAAKQNVVEKVDELREAIEELESLGGRDLIVDAAMMGTNALADHLEGDTGAQTILDILAEHLASR